MSTPVTKLTGSLLLDYETVKTAPAFFALLALVLRASGLSIITTGKSGADKYLAQVGISFNEFYSLPVYASESRLAKFNRAMSLLQTGPVIWPDVDFGSWSNALPKVDNIPGLTILNWAQIVAGGGIQKLGKA